MSAVIPAAADDPGALRILSAIVGKRDKPGAYSRMSEDARRILVPVVVLANRSGETFAHVSTIAALAGCSVRSAQRGLAALARMGLVKRIEPPGYSNGQRKIRPTWRLIFSTYDITVTRDSNVVGGTPDSIVTRDSNVARPLTVSSGSPLQPPYKEIRGIDPRKKARAALAAGAAEPALPGMDVAPRSSRRRQPTGPAADVMAAWCGAWAAAHGGTPYVPQFPRDGATVAKILKLAGGDVTTVTRAIAAYLGDARDPRSRELRHLAADWSHWAAAAITPSTKHGASNGGQANRPQAGRHAGIVENLTVPIAGATRP